jgi:hypothetical protein
MDRNGQQLRVRAYAWNLTHGGGANRPRHEYRIQITSGVSAFENEPGGVTLILGWSETFGVYAAFDIHHHAAALGSSPSIQISSQALREAAKSGIASYKKGSGEVAVAVRPDFLASYIADHAAAHRGDLSAFLEPAAEEAPPEEDPEPDFMAMADPARSHRLGHVEELAERQSVLDRLAALERELEDLRPRLVMIGHNNPPEPMVPDEQVLADELAEASAAIRDELAQVEPDVVEVAKRATTLQRVASLLRHKRASA